MCYGKEKPSRQGQLWGLRNGLSERFAPSLRTAQALPLQFLHPLQYQRGYGGATALKQLVGDVRLHYQDRRWQQLPLTLILTDHRYTGTTFISIHSS